ncbi:MAG: flagellar protein FlaG [bacterium]|nr:flagellar protein FlaG [bacterium]
MTMEPTQKTTNTTMAYQGSSASVVAPDVTARAEAKAEAARKENTEAEKASAENLTQPEVASESSLRKAVEEINKKSSNMEAIFGYHEGTNRVTIKILDKDTKEIKKEYPAEKTLDMIQKVWEMAGLMVDEKR